MCCVVNTSITECAFAVVVTSLIGMSRDIIGPPCIMYTCRVHITHVQPTCLIIGDNMENGTVLSQCYGNGGRIYCRIGRHNSA